MTSFFDVTFWHYQINLSIKITSSTNQANQTVQSTRFRKQYHKSPTTSIFNNHSDKIRDCAVRTNLTEGPDAVMNTFLGQHRRRWRMIGRWRLLVVGGAERAVAQWLAASSPLLQQTLLRRLQSAERTTAICAGHQNALDGDRAAARLVRADLAKGQVAA